MSQKLHIPDKITVERLNRINNFLKFFHIPQVKLSEMCKYNPTYMNRVLKGNAPAHSHFLNIIESTLYDYCRTLHKKIVEFENSHHFFKKN